MRPPLKYQPYHGYGYGKPWYWYGSRRHAPHRVKTRSDWRMASPLQPTHSPDEPCHSWLAHKHGQNIQRCALCGKMACSWCGCWHPWKRESRTGGSTYLKRLAHRTFRRCAKALIWHELNGHDGVSHALRYCGDYLD